MKRKLLLPIDTPDFTCYNHMSCANGIIKALAKDKFNILMCSKYINCYYKESSANHKLCISFFDWWYTVQNFMQEQIINLLKEVYQKRKTDILLMVKKCLIDGNYVLGKCNRAYLGNNVNGDKHLFDFVIVGFDDIEHNFILYGLDSLDKFSCYHINYQNFVESLFDTNIQKIVFNMWRHNENAHISLDFQNMIFEFEDYVNSANRRLQYTNDKFYGLKAMEELSRHFYKTAKHELTLRDAYLNQFFIHKWYMKQRIEYLSSIGIIGEEWNSIANQVYQMGKDVLNLGRTFNTSNNMSMADKIIQIIEETITKETDYLPHIIEGLKSYSMVQC